MLTLACSLPTLAQRSNPAAFDTSRVVEIEGSVLALRWVDPVGLSVLSRAGDVWEIELGALRDVMQASVSARTLAVGTEIVVAGFPASNGDARLYGGNLLLPGRNEIVLRPGRERRWIGRAPKR